MDQNKKLKALAICLQQAADNIHNRIPDEGPILGWRGFHTDLESVSDLVSQLELGARGIFREESPTPSEGNEP